MLLTSRSGSLCRSLTAVSGLLLFSAALQAQETGKRVALIFGNDAYQLSPLKQVCLRHCRSPLSVILHGWHDGYGGAFRMGFKHGAYCLGCCWGLMLVLFAVGLMNLVWMVVLTVAIFVEKVFSQGPLISRLIALALVLSGIFTLVMPWFSQPMMN